MPHQSPPDIVLVVVTGTVAEVEESLKGFTAVIYPFAASHQTVLGVRALVAGQPRSVDPTVGNITELVLAEDDRLCS